MKELFERYIDTKLSAMQGSHIDLVSGDIHRAVGGYPGAGHRMPQCCAAMRSRMKNGDEILCAPPKGNGATLKIRYYKRAGMHGKGSLASDTKSQPTSVFVKNIATNVVAPATLAIGGETTDAESIIEAFNSDMENIYHTAAALGYTPTYFWQMIQQMGGYQAAKKLVNSKNPQAGLTSLRKLGRLDLSVEAHVIKPKYKQLFSEYERQTCLERLEALGYKAVL